MSIQIALIVATALGVSCALTGLVRKLALAYGVLDVPNQRSSHIAPTPRGGGASIVLVVTIGSLILAAFGVLHSDLLQALLGGGFAVAAIGFLDDRRAVPASIRLAVHVAAAVWALISLGGFPPIHVGHRVVYLGWTGHVLAGLGIVWALNLFNFMDGIDGIAASEGIFVSWGAAALGLMAGQANQVSAVAWVSGAACCGFLVWNWPPAKIFMGDVGSGFLGYVIAVMALASSRLNSVDLLVWLILAGVFVVDATVTLIRRSLRWEPLHQAHRTHAYQWLARRWGSHRRTTVTVMAINAFWLLPSAWLVLKTPRYSIGIAVGALLPLIGVALAAGAGKREGGRCM